MWSDCHCRCMWYGNVGLLSNNDSRFEMLSACGMHIAMNGNTSSMLMHMPQAGLLMVGSGFKEYEGRRQIYVYEDCGAVGRQRE